MKTYKNSGALGGTMKAKITKSHNPMYGKTSKFFIVIMLAIPVLNWLVFFLGVNTNSFILAFKDMSGQFSVVNFKMFWESITQENGTLLVGLSNTLTYFVVSNFIMFPLTVTMCYFLYKKILAYKFFRIVIYLPAIISSVVMTGLFDVMIANDGPVGVLLTNLGVKLPAGGLLGTIDTATPTIVVYTMWTGLCTKMLLISGAMARIPVEVLESGRIDGVGLGGELLNIIVPLMWPTLSTLLLLSLTGLLSSTGPILLLSSAPFQLRTQTISYWIFAQVWNGGSLSGGQYGMVAATGLCFTAVLIPIVFGIRRIVRLIPSVEY